MREVEVSVELVRNQISRVLDVQRDQGVLQSNGIASFDRVPVGSELSPSGVEDDQVASEEED